MRRAVDLVGRAQRRRHRRHRRLGRQPLQHQRRRGLGRRQHLEGDLAQHPQRAPGPRHQLHQVIAGDVLHHPPAVAHDLARAVDEAAPRSGCRGRPPPAPAAAPRHWPRPPPDRRLAIRRHQPAMIHRLEGQPLPLGRERRLDLGQRRAGARDQRQRAGLVEPDARQPAGGQRRARHRPAHRPRAAADDPQRPRRRPDRLGQFRLVAGFDQPPASPPSPPDAAQWPRPACHRPRAAPGGGCRRARCLRPAGACAWHENWYACIRLPYVCHTLAIRVATRGKPVALVRVSDRAPAHGPAQRSRRRPPRVARGQRKDLGGVQQPARIEDILDPHLRLQIGRRRTARPSGRASRPHAMLAGQAAAHLDAEPQDLGAERLAFSRSPGLLASNRISGCMLPSPAWKTLATLQPVAAAHLADARSTRAALDTGIVPSRHM
jgi:hypothetical protein